MQIKLLYCIVSTPQVIRSELSGAPETSEDVNIHNSTGNEIFVRAVMHQSIETPTL